MGQANYGGGRGFEGVPYILRGYLYFPIFPHVNTNYAIFNIGYTVFECHTVHSHGTVYIRII